MNIELLYFEGCPNHEPTRRLVKQVLAAEGIQAEIQEVAVTSEEEAVALRFLGSPSVRVNGKDIEPGTDRLSQFGLDCRVYRDGNRVVGVPPRRLLTAALLEEFFGASQDCCAHASRKQEKKC